MMKEEKKPQRKKGRGNRERRTRNIERIKLLRLLDDLFMKVVLKGNIEGVQDIIQAVLKRKDIVVLEVHTQDEYSNLVGHSVRIDVLARDAEGNYYNIEIQRADKGAGERRARYNLGALDWHTLPAGADYEALPETWVIFITEEDIWGKGLDVYTIERCIVETGEWFHDGGHILYVNGAYEGDDDLGKLMADFRETDPNEMHYQSLAKKAQFYKNTKGGMTSMCKVMEELIEEGREEGREEGIEIGAERTRNQLIVALLLCNTEDELLHHVRFQSLHITQSEIDTAKAGV